MSREKIVETITITVAGHQYAIDLYDNATARDFVGLLPLTLPLPDYGGQEKQATLPRPLTTAGVKSASPAAVAELVYYQPNQVIVLPYRPIGSFSGIVPMGVIHASPEQIRSIAEQASAQITKGEVR